MNSRNGNTYLLFGETRTDAHNVNNVPLDDTDVRQMFTAKGFKLFPFAIPLLLLLSQALVANGRRSQFSAGARSGVGLLLRRNGLELDSVIGVYTAACWTAFVEILFDVVPAETTDLRDEVWACSARVMKDGVTIPDIRKCKA